MLGEALLIGCLSGLFSAWLTKNLINELTGGIALPIAFFGKFYVAEAAPWWGLSMGAVTALAGSLLPAWSARRSRSRKCSPRSPDSHRASTGCSAE